MASSPLLALALVVARAFLLAESRSLAEELATYPSNATSINLRNRQLSGRIPHDIGRFANLEELDLQNNALEGPIPPELGSLGSLRVLRLHRNQLSGPVPAELGSLDNLEELHLQRNGLRSIPPELGNLSSLTELRLEFNQLTDIPAEVGDLSSLRSLRIAQNHLAAIPPDLSRLSNLQVLEVRGNQLTGGIPRELGGLRSLRELDLRRNRLSGRIPRELGNLGNLSELHLGSNQLTGGITHELDMLRGLLVLDISFNQLTGEIPHRLSVLKDLRILNLRGNRLSGPIPAMFGDLDSLTILDLRDNELTYLPESGYANLASLTFCYLGDNNLTGQVPAEFGKLPSLSVLSLENNWLTGGIPPEIGRTSTSLEQLYLQNNELSGTIPPELGGLSFLTELHLQSNQLTGVPPELGRLSNLEELYLQSNQLTGVIPPEFRGLTNARVLWLQNNQLTGGVPPELGSLRRLRHLDLSYNELNGTIPPELSNLSRCSRVSLGGNQLCAAGFFMEVINKTVRCSECAPGEYSTHPGSMRCEVCSPGSSSMDPGSTECLRCAEGSYAVSHGSSACTECPDGMVTGTDGASRRGDCVLEVWQMEFYLCAAGLLLATAFASFALLSLARVSISDVRTVEDEVVITTNSQHYLLRRPLPWPPVRVRLNGTGVHALDWPEEALEATRVDSMRLRLSAKVHYPIEGSVGTIRVAFPNCLLCIGHFGVPLVVPLSLALFLVPVCFGVVASVTKYVHLCIIPVGVALGAALPCWRLRQKTPLSDKLKAFRRDLAVSHPRAQRCERGAPRAISAGQLRHFYDVFSGFVLRRNMHYMVHNIIKPLTARDRVSFAELVGPGMVDYFVSHNWASPFRDMVSSIQKHAESLEGSGWWPETRYWICSFCNSQWDIQKELGDNDITRSSFFLALHSEGCKGTALMLDSEASPLTRSWCLFELVQTLNLRSERSHFRFDLCTSMGILQEGNASAEVAIKLGRKIDALRMEDAQASSAADKRNIDQLVREMDGGFPRVNKFVQTEMLLAVETMRKFLERTFGDIQRNLTYKVSATLDSKAPSRAPSCENMSLEV